MRRSIIVLLALAIAAVAAPTASAKSTCKAPNKPAWHSCLTARHQLQADGKVKLKRATPSLVIRLGTPCPATLDVRTVVLRTSKGKRLARETVTGKCSGDVLRYRVNIRPKNLELKPGTVIRSYWSDLPDHKFAPKVKVG